MYFTPSVVETSATFSPPISAGAFFTSISAISCFATGRLRRKSTRSYSAGKATLEVHVLGSFAVLRGQTRLALQRSKKTRALLAYLAVTNRAHSRDRLCAMFWPVPDDPRAAKSRNRILALVESEPGDEISWIDRRTFVIGLHVVLHAGPAGGHFIVTPRCCGHG